MDTTTMNKTKTTWALDPSHSEIEFKVKHLMISNVKGAFTKFNVEVQGEDIFTAPVKATIDASSISTKDNDRDNHLKSADFFDAENFKDLVFESTGFKKVDDDEYKLEGVLTIKDKSNKVTLNVEFGGVNKDPWGNEKAGFSISGKLNRKDWGLTWNAALETGGVLVGEEVKIMAEIQLLKQVG